MGMFSQNETSDMDFLVFSWVHIHIGNVYFNEKDEASDVEVIFSYNEQAVFFLNISLRALPAPKTVIWDVVIENLILEKCRL